MDIRAVFDRNDHQWSTPRTQGHRYIRSLVMRQLPSRRHGKSYKVRGVKPFLRPLTSAVSVNVFHASLQHKRAAPHQDSVTIQVAVVDHSIIRGEMYVASSSSSPSSGTAGVFGHWVVAFRLTTGIGIFTALLLLH